MTPSVSAVAIDADGLAVSVLALSGDTTPADIERWAVARRQEGFRVAALPFTPQEGVVVAESMREGVAHA